ncbi:MAG: F0F1 ATP synthase subunit delta [Formosimonas sp.]
MAEISTIARPYAQAAFDVAKSSKALTEWSSFLNDAATVAEQSEVRQLSANPQVTAQQLLMVFQSAIGKVDGAQLNFLSALVEQSRVAALPAIAQAFAAHKHAFEGSADAHIVSAYPLNAQDAVDIAAALEKKLGKKLNTTVTVDESLIGGFCVTVGDEVLDMSMRAKLARMKTTLTT